MIYCRGTWESCRASGMTLLRVWCLAEDGQELGLNREIHCGTWNEDGVRAHVERIVMNQMRVGLVRNGYAQDIVWDWYEEPPCERATRQMQINLDAPKYSPRLRSLSR